MLPFVHRESFRALRGGYISVGDNRHSLPDDMPEHECGRGAVALLQTAQGVPEHRLPVPPRAAGH